MQSPSTRPRARVVRVVLFAPDRVTRDLLAFPLRIDGHDLQIAQDVPELHRLVSEPAAATETILVWAHKAADARLADICRRCEETSRYSYIFIGLEDRAEPTRGLRRYAMLRSVLEIDAVRAAVRFFSRPDGMH